MNAGLEHHWLDGALWAALLRSRSFWLPQDHGLLLATLGLMLVLLLAIAGLPRLFARRRHIAGLHGDMSGSATAVDFVLVVPIFVFFMFLVFQFTILAKNHLFTHYAAYSAARSARVNFCPAMPLPVTTGNFSDQVIFGIKVCTDDETAQTRADYAARMALIPAAPYKQLKCASGCQIPEAVLRSVVQTAGINRNWNAVKNQALYMFDTQNVAVTVERAPMATYAASNRIPHVPVVATVEARFLLLDLTARIFATGRRPDKKGYYAVSKAEVSLL
ncbi:TadE/TadG family type IV pilus assembly protein [Neorhizobium galegae]|uniref:TadE/TadG family type IV pilus assembly protein n=1 Tax=Neorhizobium galegae TaxID=399 RepID=UPI000620FF41|nr:TadE/TadG family type IV pilus assembly protein [Neorhizobium galegae]CDZ56621.1 Hypothetical protein NGAL_HAMBI2566_11720 [Neorhizobium galegae bv. orientalis]KAB1122702.1 hypothetical protein F4V90_18500 [Neorhizobium galegae]MCQ1570296.1 pilus assembly protein [Neorhizobium galegae]MCQ1807863.1 pilus assembly protein [Neorhizobium galegae]UIY31848.1 pilus assembly protein [Neorhizobium galegae]